MLSTPMWIWSATCRRIQPSIIRHSRFYSSRQNDRFRVLFFGTDDFAVKHLKALIADKGKPNSCIKSIDLVCPPDRRTGRKRKEITASPTKNLAEVYGIPVHHTPDNAKTLDGWKLPVKEFDLGVVVSFGYFVPAEIIHGLKHGAINVHPSLLPKYRGAAPIQHTILAGDEVTGVTVQELDDKKFDAGRILAQRTMDITGVVAPSYRDLKERLSSMGSRLLMETLQNFDEYKKYARPQDLSKVTSAPKIQKEWSEIDFAEMEAWQVEQLYRAIGDQYPLRTIYTFSRIKRSKKIKQRYITMQLLNMYIPNDSPLYYTDAEPGTFMYDDRTMTLHVACADRNPVAFTHIKAEGGNPISARDFVNGYEVRNHEGQFGYFTEEDVKAGASGVRVTKRRDEYIKSIRRRMKMRKKEFEAVYGVKTGRGRD